MEQIKQSGGRAWAILLESEKASEIHRRGKPRSEKASSARPGESLSGRRKNTHEDPEGGEGIGGRGRSEPGDWE